MTHFDRLVVPKPILLRARTRRRRVDRTEGDGPKLVAAVRSMPANETSFHVKNVLNTGAFNCFGDADAHGGDIEFVYFLRGHPFQLPYTFSNRERVPAASAGNVSADAGRAATGAN